MSTSFTHEQAEEICDDFEDLIDTELIIHSAGAIKCYIDHVAIVPFNVEQKEIAIAQYRQTRNIASVAENYSGSEFDVIIIASDVANPGEIITQDIREYIANNGVGYNFPE